MKSVRCAIYTRKSSDEGLEQSFNSLDAQREACAAYILSQASEGWVAVPDRYDDGGLSGGTLDRPGLQRLLADIAEGRVDIIVVYKVDRLTRSLFDFAKLVEQLDKTNTSFVSVTQSFNTTTSMGRLTLNMLLSFAQFEREVTAERIRDKIAASKAKGMWMGGIPPLGYEPDGRSLKIVDAHADIVRDIFERYVRLGNVRHVAEQLARDSIISPVRVKVKSGATYGGVPLTRGQIYGILKCSTYVGEVHHKGQVFEGLHPAIVDRDVWDQVQAKLADNLQGHRSGSRAEQPSMLAGKIIDEAGEPLIPAHACKGRVRHRYYVSRALHHGDAAAGFRIPASEIEALVAQRLQALFADALTLIDQVKLDVPIDQLTGVIDRTEGVAEKLSRKDRALVGGIIDEVRVHASRIEIACSAAAIAKLFEIGLQPDAPTQVELACDVRVTRTGRVVKIVQADGTVAVATPNQAMVNLVAKAHRWWGELRKGEMNVTAFAARERVNPAYLTRVLRLAFLSPRATDALLAGRGLHRGAADLIAAGAIPASWIVQDQLWTVGSR